MCKICLLFNLDFFCPSISRFSISKFSSFANNKKIETIIKNKRLLADYIIIVKKCRCVLLTDAFHAPEILEISQNHVVGWKIFHSFRSMKLMRNLLISTWKIQYFFVLFYCWLKQKDLKKYAEKRELNIFI